VSAVNTAQSSGTDLTGATGSAIFSGSGAAGISVSMTSASGIATAKAGAAANSTDISNLTAMQTALTTANPAGQTNTLIFNLSSSVQNATTAQTALTAIAAQAKTTADTNSGVDLNTEAANLLQYQQAFQASSKVIQTAETIFTQLLSIN
jgi:flagellar hook-associated protein 1 FlgK